MRLGLLYGKEGKLLVNSVIINLYTLQKRGVSPNLSDRKRQMCKLILYAVRICILKLTHNLNLEFGSFIYAALTANLSCDGLNIFVKFSFLFEIKREQMKKS